jgi:hypothetical protein
MGSAVTGTVAHLRGAAQAGRHRHARGRLKAALAMALSKQQRRANLRLGLILATVALVFGVGFIAKVVVLGG